jgi:hypothetical protein
MLLVLVDVHVVLVVVVVTSFGAVPLSRVRDTEDAAADNTVAVVVDLVTVVLLLLLMMMMMMIMMIMTQSIDDVGVLQLECIIAMIYLE